MHASSVITICIRCVMALDTFKWFSLSLFFVVQFSSHFIIFFSFVLVFFFASLCVCARVFFCCCRSYEIICKRFIHTNNLFVILSTVLKNKLACGCPKTFFDVLLFNIFFLHRSGSIFSLYSCKCAVYLLWFVPLSLAMARLFRFFFSLYRST